MLDELAQAASFLKEIGERLNTLTKETYEAQGITPVDLRDARETAERIVPGLPLPGLLDEPTPIVVTKDGYLVGSRNVTRTQLARARAGTSIPRSSLTLSGRRRPTTNGPGFSASRKRWTWTSNPLFEAPIRELAGTE